MKSIKLYKKYADGRHWAKHPTIYAETFANFLKNNKFKGLVIDIGCGDGRDVNVFSKFGLDAVGVDCSKKEIKSTKEKFPDLKFDVQEAENLKFKDNSVDACFMINVIHYTDKPKALQEVFRVLRPKGYFFIHFNIEITDKDGHLDYHHDQKEILQLISKFKIIKRKTFERIDFEPIKHKHKIIELILQKPSQAKRK